MSKYPAASSREEAQGVGYADFLKEGLLGDSNPYDPFKAEWTWWEDGWWKANREVFASGAADYVEGAHASGGSVIPDCPWTPGTQKAAVWKEGLQWAEGRGY